jgi:hypothetical protein
MGNDNDAANKWCILRTAAPRTLLLARSLADAGFNVWTPEKIEKRQGRGRDRRKVEERALAITPTFVFARGDRAMELVYASRAPVSPHPPFSVLRHRGSVPLIRDASLFPLRGEEERQRRRYLKTTRKVIAPGSRIVMTEGAFAGMTGVVESSSGKAARINFGGGFAVSIASYILTEDVVQSANRLGVSLAA